MNLLRDFNYPEGIKLIRDLFTSNNFKIYLSGGSVRDILLGLKPRDYDLMTNALPNEIKQILIDNKIKYHLRGDEYGTYGIIINKIEIDIGSFMKDYPKIVFGVSIQDDANRRDLTYNALYYDFLDDKIIDLVSGLQDLRNGITKIIGNPIERFNEDKLRILRVLRYACKYNHIIGNDTWEVIRMYPKGLITLSKERVY